MKIHPRRSVSRNEHIEVSLFLPEYKLLTCFDLTLDAAVNSLTMRRLAARSSNLFVKIVQRVSRAR